MSCDGIFQDELVSCSDPLELGVEQELYLANLEDCELIPQSEGSNVIVEIKLPTGKTFFKFGGVQQTINARVEKNATGLSVNYRHIVDCSVFQVDSLSKKNLEAMAYKPLLAIVRQPNDSSFGDSSFTLLGAGRGLDVTINTRDYSDQETGGAFRLELSTPSNKGEAQLPLTYQPGYLKLSAALVAGVQQAIPDPGDQVSLVAGVDSTNQEMHVATQKCIDEVLLNVSYVQPNFVDDALDTVYQWNGVNPAPKTS